MSTTTDGQICYGILFEENDEFPWDEFDDIDKWWVECILKFKPSFDLFTKDGEWINGERPDQKKIDKYYEEKEEFEKKNKKLPIELVNYCSCDVPMYIIAVKGSTFIGNRGYPLEFNILSLTTKETVENKNILIEFCKKHKIEHGKGPEWYLSSYGG